MLNVVAAALVNPQGKILLQKRPGDRSMPGLWEFPGGKIEPGETPEVALVRELKEELGIFVTPANLTPASFASEALGSKHLLLLLYVCRKWEEKPQPLHATKLCWADLNELGGFDMPPADRPLVTALQHLL